MAGPSISVVVQQERSGTIQWHAKWRRQLPDGTSKQMKRPVGKAWMVRGDDGWTKRRGRAPEGYLTRDAAITLAGDIVAAAEADHDAEVVAAEVLPTVADLLAGFIEHRTRTAKLRPSTLRDYRSMIGTPHIQRLADRPAAAVDPADVEKTLQSVEAAGGEARTVNKYRALLSAAWAWGAKPTALKLTENPAKLTDRRRIPPAEKLEWFSIEEIEQLARALTDSDGWRETIRESRGAKRRAKAAEGKPPTPETPAKSRKLSDDELAEFRHCEQQDPHLVRIAAYLGLRLSEIVALQWQHIDFQNRAVRVQTTFSAGELVDAPKSGKHRSVPMSERALVALNELSRRTDFTQPTDFVAVTMVGGRISGPNLTRRVRAARDHIGLRPLSFHKLRHTFGSVAAAGGVDLVAIQSAMGHANITTTQIYLHAKSHAEAADAFTAAQADAPAPQEGVQHARDAG